jgi:hypothetical protein
MAETKLEVYKGWEISIVCQKCYWIAEGVLNRFSGYAYIRPKNREGYRGWSAPWFIPKRDFLFFESCDQAFEVLKKESHGQIDAIKYPLGE